MAKVVFSRSLEKAEWNNTRLIRSSAEDAVAKMKHKPGGNMLIFCSANLSSTLMRAGLIDEYRSEAFEVRLCGPSLRTRIVMNLPMSEGRADASQK